MATNKPENPGSGNRENQIGAVRQQLLSPLPSDVKRGIDQVRQWLIDNPEEQETYRFILNIARENSSLLEQISSLLKEMIDKGSSLAVQSLRDLHEQADTSVDDSESLPKKENVESQSSNEQDLMIQADDAYYTTEYDKAILLYQQILRREPDNIRARQQLEKSTLNLMASISNSSSASNSSLPRDAVQFYRRARSYIAARDFNSAIEFLKIAMEKAQTYGKKFPEAEVFLEITQDQITAAEHKINADNAIQDERWEDAISALKQAHTFDPSDDAVNKMLSDLQGLLKAEALLDPFGMQVNTDRGHKLETISATLRDTEEVKELINAKRYKVILAKYSLYKAEADLHKWRFLTAIAPQGRLKEIQRTTKSTKDILSQDDPALKYVDERIRQLQPLRITFFVVLLLILGYIFFLILNHDQDDIIPPITSTPTPTIAFTPTDTPPLPTETPTHTPTPTVTSTITVTDTALSPTQATLGNGYVNPFYTLIHARETPNGKAVGDLTRNQVVTILEQKTVSQDRWYLCQWDTNGTTAQGWILAEYLIIGPIPTPRPTYSP